MSKVAGYDYFNSQLTVRMKQVWIVVFEGGERIWGVFSSEKKAMKSVKQHKLPYAVEYQVYDVDYRLKNKPVKYAK